MSDLRVDTEAIEETYLRKDNDLWSVTPVWHPKSRDARIMSFIDAGKAKRVVNGVIRLFEAKTSVQHREAVEIFNQNLLWDGPPIRLSNKGHLRLATYLFKYFAHVRIIPTSVIISEPSVGKNLIEVDAVAVSYPHRVWWIPATLLLPREVAKNVHFKIGVDGDLDDGPVELFIGRLTNWPPFVITPIRSLNGILMGAIPHAFETPLGYVFDFMDGGDYYARKRNAQFKARHPDSTNPTWDWIQDLAYDIPNWAKEQAVIGAETAQALFGKTFDNIKDTINAIISFYVWVWNTFIGVVSNIANKASDVVQGGTSNGTPSAGLYATGPTAAPGGTAWTAGSAGAVGGGAKYYKGPAVTGTATGAPNLTGVRQVAMQS
eukprot:GHUV01000177.1.p1 GENE.GHUV01000177.1~~GHUV01000177.1.p1  ORF type:complete len:376 (+),score=115.02 GHUV01000177.1:645-1772(+)